MLEKILKLYAMAMAGQVRSPLPHLFGPPGCGKSTVVEQAAQLLGVNLHVINVSRISPLELEGIQMPIEDNSKLHLLTATFWTQLKEGDILLLDEFLRGFPEVYNGLLDILTARKVGGFALPNVFIIGASNSVVAYDKALEDRLLHLPVADPRNKKKAKAQIAQLIVNELGLIPELAQSGEMTDLLDQQVLPMYDVLDQLGHRVRTGTEGKGHSPRNLIGQAKLREVTVPELRTLIDANNARALREGKFQYVLLLSGAHVDPRYVQAAERLRGNPKITPIQALNMELNLQLVQLEKARKETHQDDDPLA